MSKVEAPEIKKFNKECEANIAGYSTDDEWQQLSTDWYARGVKQKISRCKKS